MDLFRAEAIEHKRDNLLGDVIVAQPSNNRLIGGVFAVVVLIIVAYLCIGERTKRASVSGYIVPEGGLIKVFTQQAGTVTALKVNEGQFVKQGTVLATISFEHSTVAGPLRDQIDQRLAQRKVSLDTQRLSSDANFSGQIMLVEQRIVKFRSDMTTIDQSIEAQKDRLVLMREMLAREGELAREGYVGKIEFQESKMRLMDQENRLRERERQKLALARQLIDSQNELASLPARALVARSELIRSTDNIVQEQIENEDHRENTIIAPIDGTVTAIQKSVGKFATPGQPLLSLVPKGTQLIAQFNVTSEAIGFVKPGNEARLQFVAFPYQKFGSYKGQVLSISRTAVPEEELPFPVLGARTRERELYYIVKVQPDKDFVVAYGVKETLQPGMRVEAKIWVDRRRLIEWILEPLFSIAGRM